MSHQSSSRSIDLGRFPVFAGAAGHEAVAASSAAVAPAVGAAQFRTLQALRAVAALLVVMFHTGVLCAVAGYRPFYGLFGDGTRGVDLFFVLSGFIVTYVHAADVGRAKRLGNYLFKRLSRIYPSVWVLTICAVLIYALGFGGADKAGKLTLWNVAATALLLPERQIALVNVTWTLKYEIFFYLLFALAIARGRLGWIVLGAWQAAVLAVTLTGADYQHLWGGFYLRPICIDFGIGVLAAFFVMRSRERLAGRLTPLWAGLFAGMAVFAGAALFETYPASHPLQIPDVLFGLSAATIVVAAVLLEGAGRIRIAPWLVGLGDASYAVYLVHFSVISLLVASLSRLDRAPLNDLWCLAIAAIAVGMGVVFDRCIDRPLRRLCGRLRRPGTGDARAALGSGS